jgi:uncharacterized membrane protein YebE (DUF533 family)
MDSNKTMDAKGLFEQILNAGRELTEQGQGYAQKKLDIPAEGPEREASLSGMGKGAAIAGVLALLLGTKAGRGITGAGLKLGTLAGLGGIAYKTYQDWQSRQTGQALPQAGTSVEGLTGMQAEHRSLTLLKAMIAAAKADGHIDATEGAKIEGLMSKLELDAATAKLIKTELAKPLDPKDIAAAADSPAAAAEIYLTSLLVIDVDNKKERAYLDQLAEHLKIPKDLALQMEAQAKQSA